MEIFVHYPSTREAKEELAKRVAEVHARAVVEKMQKLSLGAEELDVLWKELLGK